MMSEEIWTNVIVHNGSDEYKKGVFGRYQVSNLCRIKNVETGKISKGKSNVVKFNFNNESNTHYKNRVCLQSFKPEPTSINTGGYSCVKKNVDNGNVLDNLYWLSKSEHAIIKNTTICKKTHIHGQGKEVVITNVRGDKNNSIIDTIFDSTKSAEIALNIKPGLIRSSIFQNTWCKDYKFKYKEEPLIEGEVFKEWNGYQISNKGRYRTKRGKLFKGSKRGKYRTVGLTINGEYKNYSIHRIIWEAFNGPIPEGLVVMHNDEDPKIDEEGCERNWLEDLSLGTKQENSQSFHDNRTDLKRVRCVETGVIYNNARHAMKETEISNSTIGLVCKKKQKTAGGFTWEYVS